jgi:hypothetical protein
MIKHELEYIRDQIDDITDYIQYLERQKDKERMTIERMRGQLEVYQNMKVRLNRLEEMNNHA